MVDVKELLKQRQESFIETRTIIANEVDKFMRNIKEVDPALLKEIVFPTGETAKELLPSMWVEPFDEDMYKNELTILNTFISQVQEVAEQLNQKALQILKGV